MKAFLKWFALLLGVLTLVAAIAYWAGRQQPSAPPPMTESDEAPVLREVILYFADSRGEFLVSQHEQIADCADHEACVRAVLEELIKGPRTSELVAVLPQQTQLRQLSLAGDTAILDFSRELASLHPGGSISELLSVYGIVNTLAVNFPHLRQARILIDGQNVESLKGHVDLRGPVAADFRYTRPPHSAAAGKEGERP